MYGFSSIRKRQSNKKEALVEKRQALLPITFPFESGRAGGLPGELSRRKGSRTAQGPKAARSARQTAKAEPAGTIAGDSLRVRRRGSGGRHSVRRRLRYDSAGLRKGWYSPTRATADGQADTGKGSSHAGQCGVDPVRQAGIPKEKSDRHKAQTDCQQNNVQLLFSVRGKTPFT